jgi:hypothetical protein
VGSLYLNGQTPEQRKQLEKDLLASQCQRRSKIPQKRRLKIPQ